MKNSTQNIYTKRIMKVLHFIQKNLDEKLDLEQLAKVALFSPFHFHRIFKAFTGESVAKYMRRLKIERAAGDLKFSDKQIGIIALEAGYENIESFSRAFKTGFGKPPIEFRKESKEKLEISIKKRLEDSTFGDIKVKIISDLPSMDLYCMRHTGKYSNSGITWNKLMKWVFINNYKIKNAIGISYDDPNITKEENIRYDACVELAGDIKIDEKIHNLKLKGGKYAVSTIVGPYESLGLAYDYIYGKWLPENNIELRNAPCFEIYKNNARGVSPEEFVTLIYVPIV